MALNSSGSDFPLSDEAEDLWGLACTAAEADAPDDELGALMRAARRFTVDNWAGLATEQVRCGIDFNWQEILDQSESLEKFRAAWGIAEEN